MTDTITRFERREGPVLQRVHHGMVLQCMLRLGCLAYKTACNGMIGLVPTLDPAHEAHELASFVALHQVAQRVALRAELSNILC
jgi:hypothetical protein